MGMLLTETLGLLSTAREIVTEGEKYMFEQIAIVDGLEREGYDTTDAIDYLETLEAMQANYVSHMEKLERQVLLLVRPEY
jgi:hypothetical protein